MKRRFFCQTDEGRFVFCQVIENDTWDFGIAEQKSVIASKALGRVIRVSLGPDRHCYHAISYVIIDVPSVGGFRTKRDAVKYLCIAEKVARNK